MRVIAGTHRGRQLRAPPGPTTRPTSDRVREAIFDILQAFVDLDGARVLDLFAGSGAMGIEALSRGASGAVFVESDAGALGTLRANLTSLGLEDRAEVVQADATTWMARARTKQPRFDLALCDPPYRFDAWGDVLDGVWDLGVDLAVLESDRPLEPGPRFEVPRSRRYGGTLVTVVRRAPSASSVASAPGGRAGPKLTPREKGTA